MTNDNLIQAAEIKTWQDRFEDLLRREPITAKHYCCTVYVSSLNYMQAEIDELRAALAATKQTVPSEQQGEQTLPERIASAEEKLASALRDAALDVDKQEMPFTGPFTGGIGFYDGLFVGVEDANKQRVANIYDIVSAAELIQALNLDHTHSDRVKAEPLTEEERDDAAVDRFAIAMKEKLASARSKGRGGWQECDPNDLKRMLRDHVEKGDPRDVANFCMFLWNLGHGIAQKEGVNKP